MLARQLNSDDEAPSGRRAPPAKQPEMASVDDVTIDEEEVLEGDPAEVHKRLSSPESVSSPDEVVVEEPQSRRSSAAEWEGALPKAALEAPEQQGTMAPASEVKRGFFNSGGKQKKGSSAEEDKKAFLNSDEEDDDFDVYDSYTPAKRGSPTYYDSEYAERRYSDDDWNPWSCENILVGVQLVCCLLVVVACLAAVVVPLFAHRLNPDMRLAVQHGDTEMVRMLLNNGSVTHVDATGSRDMTALHWASMRGQTDVAELLLENRASFDKVSSSGLKPVHYAVKGGHKGVVGALLEARANSNATDNNGWTPLHWAGVWGRADIARMLIAADANPTVVCEERAHKTALFLAQSNGHSALVRILDRAMEAYVERVNASLLSQLNTTV